MKRTSWRKMMSDIEVKTYRSPVDMKTTFAATIQDTLCETTELGLIPKDQPTDALREPRQGGSV